MASFALTYTDTEISLLSHASSRPNRARFALPAGLVRGGRISDPATFGKLIRQAMAAAQPKPIKATEVVIGLPEEHAFIKILEMPGKLHEKELKSVFDFQWQNLLPIPRDQVYFDYKVLNQKTTKQAPKTKTQRVLILAYPRDIIASLISALSQAKLLPKTVIPLSFGYAELYSPQTEGAALIVKSESGANIGVAAVEKGATHFSTTIHAPALSPVSVKQLNNIRTFYEKGTTTKRGKITSIIIMGGQYAEFLKQQFSTLSLPTTVAAAREFFITEGTKPHEMDHFIPLYGLLKSKFTLSILPTEMAEAVHRDYQQAILRGSLAYMTTTLALLLYFSIVFAASLQFTSKNKVQYAQRLVDTINKQASETEQQVQALAQQLLLLTTAGAAQSAIHDPLSTVTSVLERNTTVTITTVTFDNEKKDITITGRRESRVSMSAFVDAVTRELKAKPPFQQATIEVNEAGLQTEGASDFTMTIKGLSG